jgi:nitrite reductase (NADH) small subunit
MPSRLEYKKILITMAELKRVNTQEEEQAVNASWFRAARVSDFPENGGACVRYRDQQIAVFNFTRRNEWYACQNMCPHKMQMALSRGMIGSHEGEPKIACPFHKKTFSLKTGECLNADEQTIKIFPVKVEDGYVYIRVGQQ